MHSGTQSGARRGRRRNLMAGRPSISIDGIVLARVTRLAAGPVSGSLASVLVKWPSKIWPAGRQRDSMISLAVFEFYAGPPIFQFWEVARACVCECASQLDIICAVLLSRERGRACERHCRALANARFSLIVVI